ncbi:SET domain-containing protein, partial [Lophiostoma macrostomum CBS 122681]
ENDWYEIRAIPGKGYGCFAKTLIKQGTRILSDDPLLVVPVADYYLTDVQAAFEKLSAADQALYFTLHSAHGQDPKNWPKHIHESVSHRERCRIEEQHKARIGKEPTLVSIFQTNCMELNNGAAVFPHAARFNHSCNPNATFTWNPAIKKETIHVMRDIQKGEEITFSYCDMTLDKATRRWSLKHYGFTCDCPACTGDDEDEASFAAQTAERRYRLMELDNLFVLNKRAECVAKGTKDPKMIEMLLEYVNLLIAEGDHTLRLAHAYLDIAVISGHGGDLVRAFSYARKASKVSTDCHGSDHPENKRYKDLMEQAKQARRAQLNLNGEIA